MLGQVVVFIIVLLSLACSSPHGEAQGPVRSSTEGEARSTAAQPTELAATEEDKARDEAGSNSDGYGVHSSDGLRASGKNIPDGGTVEALARSATGSLPAAAIKAVVETRKAHYKYCYDSELNLNPALSGRVIVEFTIGPSGSVLTATGTGLPKVAKCIERQIRLLRFPKPQGGGIVEVRYPFVFSPT